VLDVRPPLLSRRGAAASRTAELSTMDGRPDGAAELRRRGLIRVDELRAMGAEPPCPPVAAGWLADPLLWTDLRRALAEAVAAHAAAHPLEDGLPVEAARQRLGLPDARLVAALAAHPPDSGPPADEPRPHVGRPDAGSEAAPPRMALAVRDGRVVPAAAAPSLPADVLAGVAEVRRDLAAAPFVAPEAHRLAELGLGPRELAAAVRAGRLVRVAPGIYLLPGAEAGAVEVLAGLAQPFTLSEARRALGTTRRVAVPLLELLDASGYTERLPDDRRRLRARADGIGSTA
jgi:selenocysteine-specific elongation factor